MALHPIFIQTISYAIVLIFAVLILSFLMRGFFWQFLRVKTSLGKYVLVKIRAVNRDFYRVGRVVEGFLVYKPNKQEKRVSIPDSSVFYRSLGVSWVDLHDEKNALVKPDYTSIEGFDAVKYNNLYLRALYRPAIIDTKEKVIIAIIVILGIILIVNVFFSYTTNKELLVLKQMIGSVAQAVPPPEAL